MARRRVLVMDDDSAVLEVASALLEYLGFEAVTCARGEEAVELYRLSRELRVPFTAVILDLKVEHGLGGIDTAKAILTLNPGAKLVISSGYSNHPPICSRLFRKSLPKPIPWTIWKACSPHSDPKSFCHGGHREYGEGTSLLP